MTALPLSESRTIVVISDRVETGNAADHGAREPWPATDMSTARTGLDVTGGYLERLPLACIKAGIVDQAEIWHHHIGPGDPAFRRAGPLLAYRALPLDVPAPPFASDAMHAFFARHGAPHILVVLGLGVDAALLDACAASIRIYNSIDAPALRVPETVSARCDIVLTGAQWQSDEVLARHPDMITAVLPIGPEFAAIDMFRPLDLPKNYDLIYVAAAQPYKRHDIMFDALDRLPRDIRALCVFGYGEESAALRQDAAARGLNVDFVGPPGVPFDEVNRLMNHARFGVVCGREDGAPAILTEYMLAGLPVLANAELACGRGFILPETGRTASPADFADAIMAMRADHDRFRPREAVLARWTWPHSVERLRRLLTLAGLKKNGPKLS